MPSSAGICAFCLLDSEIPCFLTLQSSCIILCSTQMFLDCIGCYHILLTARSLRLSPEGVHPFVINSLFDSMVAEVMLCVFYHSEFAGVFALPFDIFILITSEICVCIRGCWAWVILNIPLLFNIFCECFIHSYKAPHQAYEACPFCTYFYLFFFCVFFWLGSIFLIF